MEKYQFIYQIGKGNFGSISKIKRISDGKILIWKELDYGRLDEKEKHHIVSEVNILRELRHPNIVKYYDRVIDKKNTRIYIIMEYCEGGDIGQLIKRCRRTKDFIAEDVIWKVFTQVVLALNYCHNRKEGKVLHRDIKPSNVFLDAENNVKLGDFGLSKVLSNESNFAYSNVGTPYYMSPEQIDELRYNEKSDIWSLGCFLYELVTLKPPFEATNHLSLALKIKTGKIERINNRYSEELSRVIMWMMNVNLENRPSSDDLLNLPQISLRLRERRLKESHMKLKKIEEAIKEREKRCEQREKELDLREKYLNEREELLNQKESIVMTIADSNNSNTTPNKNSHNNNNNQEINNSHQLEDLKDIYHKPISLNLSLNNYLNENIKTVRKSLPNYDIITNSTLDKNMLSGYDPVILTSRAQKTISRERVYSTYHTHSTSTEYGNCNGNNNSKSKRVNTNTNTNRHSDDFKQNSYMSNTSSHNDMPKMTIDYTHPNKISHFQFDPSLYSNEKEKSVNMNATNGGNTEHINNVNINHTNVNMNIYNPSFPRSTTHNTKPILYKKQQQRQPQHTRVSTPSHTNYSPMKRDNIITSRYTTIPRNNSYNFTHTTVSTQNGQINTSYKKSYLNDN